MESDSLNAVNSGPRSNPCADDRTLVLTCNMLIDFPTGGIVVVS